MSRPARPPDAPRRRPLSPHLGIYRFQWTMALSILHRVTGVALGAGLVLLTWWLVAAATSPEAYAEVRHLTGSYAGRLVLLGFTFALLYHLGNGVRHLLWDFGLGFELPTARASGWVVFLATIVLTVGTWFAGYALRGH